MKRVAICLSGQYRASHIPALIYSNLKYLYPEYEYDFFLAGWKYDEHLYVDYDFVTSKKFFDDPFTAGEFVNSSRLAYLLKEVSILREEYEEQNNFEYYAVLWTRVDALLFPLFFKGLFDVLNPNEYTKTSISKHVVYNDIGIKTIVTDKIDELFTNDRVAYGSSESMSKYSRVIDNVRITGVSDNDYVDACDTHRAFSWNSLIARYALLPQEYANNYRIIRPNSWEHYTSPMKCTEKTVDKFFKTFDWKTMYREFANKEFSLNVIEKVT